MSGQLKSGVKSLEATSRNTADSIFSRQNDAFLLQCQVAQRSEYSHAKLVARWKTYLTVSFAVLSVLASVLDIDWLTAVSSLLAVVLLIFNKYSDEYIMTRKKHAASVQQYIDATLYAAAIDSNVSDWGDVPSQSDLAVSVSEYENADTSAVENWYSDYSGLSGEEQIFRCQSENIRWDFDLHKKFRVLQMVLLGSVAVVMLVAFIIADPSFVKLICVLSWFAPIAEYAYSIYKEVGESIAHLQEVHKFSDEIEKKLATSSIRTTKRELIKLQHKIWERREKGYLIPDGFYEWHRKKQQDKEDRIAKVIQGL